MCHSVISCTCIVLEANEKFMRGNNMQAIWRHNKHSINIVNYRPLATRLVLVGLLGLFWYQGENQRLLSGPCFRVRWGVDEKVSTAGHGNAKAISYN